MKIENFIKYNINEDLEKKLFEDSLIFFDTSALLDFYYFSDESKTEIYQKLFEPLKGRLWITSQTEYEFLKNREKVLSKPIETYNALTNKIKNQNDSGHLDEISNLINLILTKVKSELSGQLKTLKEKTSKKDKHPFLENFSFENIEKETEKLQNHVENYQTSYISFKSEVQDIIENQKEKLNQILTKDTILEAFQKYFQSTEPLNYNAILEIVAEGKLRYQNEIPPGYLDEENKIGFQKFGDLILWKEILAKSKISGKNIILVINDLKEDWWFYNDKSKPTAPRHELIKEIFDSTKNSFWMYDINSFLFKSQKYISSTIQDGVIEEVKQITKHPRFSPTPIIMDWIFSNYKFLAVVESVERENYGYDLDLKGKNLQKQNFGFVYKRISGHTYSRLMVPIRTFVYSAPLLIEKHNLKEIVLIVEYQNKEVANSFLKHTHGKRTLRSLINSFKNNIRLVVLINDNDSYNVLFDSKNNDNSEDFPPLFPELSDNNGIKIIQGPYGIGAGPSSDNVDKSFQCYNCGTIGAWNGARCVICGHMDDD